MSPNHSARVLDRAPVLFSPGNHFPCIRDYAITVATVKTVQFFNTIKVSQLMAIHNNIFTSIYPTNTVKSKADMLVKGYGDIKKKNGNNHGVYKRC